MDVIMSSLLVVLVLAFIFLKFIKPFMDKKYR